MMVNILFNNNIYKSKFTIYTVGHLFENTNLIINRKNRFTIAYFFSDMLKNVNFCNSLVISSFNYFGISIWDLNIKILTNKLCKPI